MGSITQSPDRVAQVLSGSAVLHAGESTGGLQQPADSNPVVEQAFTGVSVAEIVYESRQQHSSVSEGVASAGHPPPHTVTDRMGEFVPAGSFDPQSGVAGYQGETSGFNYGDAAAGGGSNYGDTLPERGMPPPTALVPSAHPAAVHPNGILMDYQATTSTLADRSPGGKRKSCGDFSDLAQHAKRPEASPTHHGLNRVPSDLAMVMGLSDGEGGDPGEARKRYYGADLSDSNIAGIGAGLAAAPTAGDGDTAQAMPARTQGTTTGGGDAVVQQPVRPTDADIIAWENQIREDELRNTQLLGEMRPLSALEIEYRSGSDIFLTKIAALQRGYSSIRRTRGDGNCFFRSFLFAYLENMLKKGDLNERDRAVSRIVFLKQQLLDAGYEELVLESPLDLLLGMVRSIGSPTDPLTPEILEANMRSDDVSNYLVFLMRIITSAEVKRRADFFAPFIMGLTDLDVETFCNKCIDPMGEESDHVQMVALTDALQVPIRVVYLDRSLAPGAGGGGCEMSDVADAPGGGTSYASAAVGGAASTAGTVASAAVGGDVSHVKVDVHDFVPEQLHGGSAEPRVHLLYRPGHYDVLYPYALQ